MNLVWWLDLNQVPVFLSGRLLYVYLLNQNIRHFFHITHETLITEGLELKTVPVFHEMELLKQVTRSDENLSLSLDWLGQEV